MRDSKNTILLGLTTTDLRWREKIAETRKFDLKELALFPTFIGPDERKEFVAELKDSPVVSVPHVHIRDDFDAAEIQYFYDHYGTRRFNIHATQAFKKALGEKFGDFKSMIYVENQEKISPMFFEIADLCGGLCLDFSHWEDFGVLQKDESYLGFNKVAERYEIGCSHASAVGKEMTYNRFVHLEYYNKHEAEDKTELEYLTKYKRYLPEFISLELENSLEEQLEIKEWVEQELQKHS